MRRRRTREHVPERVAAFELQAQADENSEAKQKACGTEQQTDEQQQAAEKFAEGEQKSPRTRREINAEIFHHRAGLRPRVRAAEHLRRALDHHHCAQAKAEKKQAAFAVFAEESQNHGREAILRSQDCESKILQRLKNEPDCRGGGKNQHELLEEFLWDETN